MYIVYAWPFFGLDQARGGFALERHESWNFWVFLWCLKSGNWVRVALLPAAACRKYPTTIATSRGIITWCCCCCCCCYFSVAVIGTILLWLSCCRLSFKNCHTWRMRNMRNFFPKRSCCRCRPKGQAAAAVDVDVDVNHSAAATLRDSAPPRPRSLDLSLSAVSECGAISAQLTYIGATWQH